MMTDSSPTPAPGPHDRPIWPAVRHGLRGRCPACGVGSVFARFLVSRPACSCCGLVLDGHEAHDFPAYIVILLLGHILIPTMVSVNAAFAVPVGWQIVIWPALVIVLALALIQPVKGGVIAYQWARRMHGFGG